MTNHPATNGETMTTPQTYDIIVDPTAILKAIPGAELFKEQEAFKNSGVVAEVHTGTYFWDYVYIFASDRGKFSIRAKDTAPEHWAWIITGEQDGEPFTDEFENLSDAEATAISKLLPVS